MKQRVPALCTRSCGGRFSPSTAGRRKNKGENATGRAAIDSDAQRDYTYQYNRRGRNVTVGAQKFSDLCCEAPDTAHTNRSLSTSKESISQNHKKHKTTLFPLVILLRCAPSRSPRRRLSGVVHPSTSPQAVAPPCGRRTRPPCRDEENNTTFTPKSTPFRRKCTTLRPFPHAGDTTRALASALQSRCISCLHPSPSHLPI